MKYLSMNSLESHFLKFDELVWELRSTGAALEETDVVCHLMTMPAEYEVVATALETLSSEKLTIAFVKNRLLDEESKQKETESGSGSTMQLSTAFVAPSGRGNFKKFDGRNNASNGNERSFKYNCYKCGKSGHKRSDCMRKESGNKEDCSWKNSKSANLAADLELDHNNEDFSFTSVARNYNTEYNRGKNSACLSWYLDSGASEHMVSIDVFLSNTRLLKELVNIKVAKTGQTLISRKTGDIKASSIVDNSEMSITIKDVLLMPDLEFNLLSIRKLDMNGYRIDFENGKGSIIKGNKIVAVAHRKFKLHEMDLLTGEEKVNSCLSIGNAELWHQRLGHINYNGLKKLKDLVDGINLNAKESV